MAFNILRPVIPYIDYAINKDYIATNLCINRDEPLISCEGKCYLEKQIKESAETNDSKEKNAPKKVQNEEVNVFLDFPVTIPKIIETSINHQVTPETPLHTRSISAIFIPPKIQFIF